MVEEDYLPATSYYDFQNRTREYHKFSNPGDTLVYGWIYKNLYITKRFNLRKEEGMMLVVEGYLANWGGMRRWLLWTEKGSDSTEEIARNILDVLNKNKQELQRLERFDLLNNLQNAQNDLKEVFGSLCKTKIKHKPKKSGSRIRLDEFGLVATGKLMHMLLPRLCVIWDKTYVLKKRFRGKRIPETGEGYYMYLERKKEELDEVIKSAASRFGPESSPEYVISKIEEEHSSFLSSKGFEGIREPVTKLLDECNFRDL